MQYSEFNLAKDLLATEAKPTRIKLILERVSLFMGELSDLLFENGQFVKPKTIQIFRWWKIAQKTIGFISDIIKIFNGKD